MFFIDRPLYGDPSVISKSVKYVFEYLKEGNAYLNHITSDSGIKTALMEKLGSLQGNQQLFLNEPKATIA